MIRYLPFLIEAALLVYCLIDCIQTDVPRNLSKTTWVFVIILLPLVGGIAWLVAGRPEHRPARNVPWPSTQTAGFPEYERPRPTAPDDDPQFLAGLRASDEEHEKMLKDWEAQLRDRERKLEGDGPAGA
ncbi:PLD nuclease N-terminal domain-containing protein [uncultured Cellulomonas sp.]|uniref:PLD nuclease N-terminal domain-containing protein n=1 Tax=uncultured Cellulomonas sp. TaxID=189682 RepID=UPI0028E80A41|nr:PLD nuclease N-terminal domain-containing protein [uncultured Cellulomonas sp.]